MPRLGEWRSASRIPASDADEEWWRRWDALNQISNASHPLLQSRFVACCIQHFGGTDVFGLSIRDSRGDVALALAQKSGALVHCIFQPSQAPVPAIVARDPCEVTPRLLGEALRATSPFALALHQHRADPMLQPDFRASDDNAVEVRGAGITISVQMRCGFAEYWNARSKGLRRNLRRHLERLDKDGIEYRMSVVTDAAGMDAAVATYGDLESRGWKGRVGTAVHSSNSQGRFYADVMERFGMSGEAIVYCLWFDDHMVAARLVVRNDRMMVILKTTYDEQFARYAPGRVLLYMLLEDAFRLRIAPTVEFYTNADRDALEWATDQREMCSSTIYRNGVMAKIAGCKRWLERYGHSTASNNEQANDSA